MPRLLIVDDEPNLLYSLRKGLESDKLEVQTSRTAKAALELLPADPPDVVLLNVRLPDMSGLDLFDQIHEFDGRLPVILMTAFATTQMAIEAMTRGAYEYLIMPVDFPQMRETVERAVELSRLNHVPAVIEEYEDIEDDASADLIVGRAPPMHEVYKAIGRVARHDMTVLITGESGTGKELVARAIFQYSRRNDQPFLAINCAAIPEALLESELFGHERGAFTGADRRRIGKFEQASGGTIFLDEIGDMPLATQAKVLRLLQEQRFERVGGNDTIQTDVRVIAATNRSLDDLVAGGVFRQDLLYRLNVYGIDLPPLRQRDGDLKLLTDHFVRHFNRELAKQVSGLSDDAQQMLRAHPWPGNVRELQSAIKYAMVRSTGKVLTADCFPDRLRTKPRATVQPVRDEGNLQIEQTIDALLLDGSPDIYDRVHDAIDRVLLKRVLEHVNANQVEASRILGITRTTLRTKLRALGLSAEKRFSAPPQPAPAPTPAPTTSRSSSE